MLDFLTNHFVLIGLGILGGIAALLVLFDGWYTIEEKNEGVFQRLGKHKKMCTPGFGLKFPLIDRIAKVVSLRIDELSFTVETKTKDNVFVKIVVAVQLRVEDAYKAFYELSDPEGQIESYVNGVLRGEVPNINLDEVFNDKDKLESAVQTALIEKMQRCGYKIENAILKEIDPDPQVKKEMNRINAADRALVATRKEAEANRVNIEEEAQARANAKKFEGEGLAAQQVAIARGRAEAVKLIKEELGECDDEEIAAFLLESNRIEGAVDMAQSASSVVLFPYSAPGSSVRDEMLQARIVDRKMQEASDKTPGQTSQDTATSAA